MGKCKCQLVHIGTEYQLVMHRAAHPGKKDAILTQTNSSKDEGWVVGKKTKATQKSMMNPELKQAPIQQSKSPEPPTQVQATSVKAAPHM